MNKSSGNSQLEWSEESGQVNGIKLVEANPSWAAEFAVQGLSQVTQYRCPECKAVFAVLGVDV